MRISEKIRSIDIGGARIRMARTPDGVLRLWATTDAALASGLGYAHARDRLVQMVMVRLVAAGRLSECLQSTDETGEIDIFMRELGLYRSAEREAARLGEDGRLLAEAYAAGVNHALQTHRRPLELLLARHRPAAWTAVDTLATIQLMSYFGLAQSQQDMEKFLIEAVRGGVAVDALKRLLAPHLDDLDASVVEGLAGLRHVSPLVPGAIRWFHAIPTLMGSNNWVVSGNRTASGRPLSCSDPHLECNRLPAIWYEAIMHTDDDYRMGITMPGIPGLVMGRTRSLSFNFTYGFMDQIDFFLEDCRDQSCRRKQAFEPLEIRSETILRKGRSPIEITIRENDLGILETDSRSPDLEDGLYLTRAWSASRQGAAASLEALAALPSATTVGRAQEIVRRVAISCNWLLADRDGNIGYQQSGTLPDRRHSGLHPVPAWESRWLWNGTVDPSRLRAITNPPEGFLATANNDLDGDEGPSAINLSMGPYRSDRIRDLLSAAPKCGITEMKSIQNDLHSLQAERFLKLFRPLLPETFAGRMLAGWDCRYDVDSRAATLFETVYDALLREVFAPVFGDDVWQSLVESTAVVADYYHVFDRVLMEGASEFFPSEDRDELVRRVLTDHLTEVDPEAIVPWGRRQRILMKNVFFGGRLPLFLGFDKGPFGLPGNRSTIVQGGVFHSHGRETTFTPSWRFISDLDEDRALTVLAGGPSGNRFSKWYATDIERWLSGDYKVLEAEPSEDR